MELRLRIDSALFSSVCAQRILYDARKRLPTWRISVTLVPRLADLSGSSYQATIARTFPLERLTVPALERVLDTIGEVADDCVRRLRPEVSA